MEPKIEIKPIEQMFKDYKHCQLKALQQAAIGFMAVIRDVSFTAVTIDKLEGSLLENPTWNELIEEFAPLKDADPVRWVVTISQHLTVLISGVFTEVAYRISDSDTNLPVGPLRTSTEAPAFSADPFWCAFSIIFFEEKNACLREKVFTLLEITGENNPDFNNPDFFKTKLHASGVWAYALAQYRYWMNLSFIFERLHFLAAHLQKGGSFSQPKVLKLVFAGTINHETALNEFAPACEKVVEIAA